MIALAFARNSHTLHGNGFKVPLGRSAQLSSQPSTTRIIGIDPGSRVTGYGIIDVDGPRLRHVASGCIRTDGADLAPRLKRIFQDLSQVVEEFGPAELAIEKVFVQRNVESALKLGQARGAAVCAAVLRDVPVFEYAPNQIKQAVVGHGHAAKEQVQAMVRLLLKLEALPPSDAADALACAVCHSHLRATAGRLAQAAATPVWGNGRRLGRR